MPQMFPMNWLYLYMLTFISVLISNNYLYFNFKIFKLKKNMNMINWNHLMIKW